MSKVSIDCKSAEEFIKTLEPYWLSPAWRVNATSDPQNHYFHIEAIKVIPEPISPTLKQAEKE